MSKPVLNFAIQAEYAEQQVRQMNDGIGPIYGDCGDALIPEESLVDTAWAGSLLVIPGASCGNYDNIFKLLGAEEVRVHDWTSSAGDWTFGLKKEGLWYFGFQTNNFPRPGFTYSINVGEPWETFEGMGVYEPVEAPDEPKFIIIVRGGMVDGVFSLDGRPHKFMLVDEDEIVCEADDSQNDALDTPDEKITALVRAKIAEDPEYFTRDVNGNMTFDELYPETAQREE